MRLQRTQAIPAVLALAILLAGCVAPATQQAPPDAGDNANATAGGQSGDSVASDVPSHVTVLMTDNVFAPESVEVLVGGTVHWENDGEAPHMVAIDALGEKLVIKPGETKALTFDKPGSYEVVCLFHVVNGKGMTGKVVVIQPPNARPEDATTQPTPPGGLDGEGLPSNATAPANGTVPADLEPAPGNGTQAIEPVRVQLTDDAFAPADITVETGGSVIWENAGAKPHGVTIAALGIDELLMPGDTLTTPFPAAGTYELRCTFHSASGTEGMVGVVRVTGEAGAPPTPAPRVNETLPGGANQTNATNGTLPVPAPVQAPNATAPAAGARVSVQDDVFTPATLAVAPGDTVVFENTGARPHSVTIPALGVDKILKPGESTSVAFAAAGSYEYTCIFHGGMAGVVNVDAAAGQAPVPTPAPGGNTTPPPADTTVPVPATPPAAPTGGATVEMRDDVFSPATLSVQPGATVTFVNLGARPHSVTIAALGVDEIVMPGKSASVTFPAAGTFSYVCAFHPGMAGSVVVGEGSAAPAPAKPAPAQPNATKPAPAPTPTPAPSPAPTRPPASGAATVSMTENAFSPGTVTVKAGESITWRNDGKAPHSLTIPALGVDLILKPGESHTAQLPTAGTFAYECIFHGGMTGTIVVQAGSTTAPAPTPAPTPTPPAAPKPAPTPAPAPAPAPSPSPAPVASAKIELTDDVFTPTKLEISAGASVTFTNRGARPHSVTIPSMGVDTILKAGESTTVTFPNAGTIAYECAFHSGMAGTIVVTAASGSTPPAPTPAPAPTPPTTPTAPPTPTPPPTPPSAPAASVTVTVGDDYYSPQTATIPAGGSVVFKGIEGSHSVTIPALGIDKVLRQGESLTVTFLKAGTYEYACVFHDGMAGTVVVTGEAPQAPSPAPVPQPEPAPQPTPQPAPKPTAPAAPATVTINVGDNYYSPTTVTIPAGSSAVFKGVEGSHSVTLAAMNVDEILRSGQSTTVRFDTPGTYEVICVFHDEMTATVVVTGDAPPSSGAPAPAPQPAPTPTPQPAPPGATLVNVGDDYFNPGTITIPVGGSVTWKNMGDDHAVTMPSKGINDILRPGGSTTVTFDTAGTYPYYCEFHSGMTGTVVVTDGAAPPPPATGSPTPPTGSDDDAEDRADDEADAREDAADEAEDAREDAEKRRDDEDA